MVGKLCQAAFIPSNSAVMKEERKKRDKKRDKRKRHKHQTISPVLDLAAMVTCIKLPPPSTPEVIISLGVPAPGHFSVDSLMPLITNLICL